MARATKASRRSRRIQSSSLRWRRTVGSFVRVVGSFVGSSPAATALPGGCSRLANRIGDAIEYFARAFFSMSLRSKIVVVVADQLEGVEYFIRRLLLPVLRSVGRSEEPSSDVEMFRRLVS